MLGDHGPLPAPFVTAGMLTPRQHLEMQAALQPHVDSSISKTINCPESISFDDFKEIYTLADQFQLKGCTTFRPNPITGSILAAASAAAQPATAPAAVSGGDAASPMPREPALAGYTYKLKWAASDHALYVTINDIEQNGRRRPFEIFINTRNLEHYAWTVALTRMISAVFRRGGDVTFVVEELKAIFDPQGGQWMNGRYVPSLLAAIGDIIEQHMIRIGFLPMPAQTQPPPRRLVGATSFSVDGLNSKATQTSEPAPRPARFCPRCGHSTFVLEGGCWVCMDCGFTRCE